MSPLTAAKMAEITTAAALKSLIILIFSEYDGFTSSAIFSIAVLKTSDAITIAEQINSKTQSVLPTFKYTPAKITKEKQTK